MPRALLPHKTSDVWNNFYKFNIINLGDLLDIDIKFNSKAINNRKHLIEYRTPQMLKCVCDS